MSHILALTEHIEEDLENKLITRLVLVDLSSAYDTVNPQKLLFMIEIGSLLQNRRFFVMKENSRTLNQKNGLAQGVS